MPAQMLLFVLLSIMLTIRLPFQLERPIVLVKVLKSALGDAKINASICGTGSATANEVTSRSALAPSAASVSPFLTSWALTDLIMGGAVLGSPSTIPDLVIPFGGRIRNVLYCA